jgi:hypothetical protein
MSYGNEMFNFVLISFDVLYLLARVATRRSATRNYSATTAGPDPPRAMQHAAR